MDSIHNQRREPVSKDLPVGIKIEIPINCWHLASTLILSYPSGYLSLYPPEPCQYYGGSCLGLKVFASYIDPNGIKTKNDLCQTFVLLIVSKNPPLAACMEWMKIVPLRTTSSFLTKIPHMVLPRFEGFSWYIDPIDVGKHKNLSNIHTLLVQNTVAL